MGKLVDEYYNIKVGDTVWVTQFFDNDEVDDYNPTVETREGIVESIDVDPRRSLFKVCFNVKYPNGRTHGADIDQMRPDGVLFVWDDERLCPESGQICPENEQTYEAL